MKVYNFKELSEQKVKYIKSLKAYVFEADYSILLHTDKGDFVHTIREGYISNCGSVPFVFRWFLKSYDPNRPLYNAAFFLHDDGYQKKGWGFLSRSDVDDMCRGMLRCAGEDRLHASAMDLAVGIGAKSHWGTNEYDNFDYMSTMTKVV